MVILAATIGTAVFPMVFHHLPCRKANYIYYYSKKVFHYPHIERIIFALVQFSTIASISSILSVSA